MHNLYFSLSYFAFFLLIFFKKVWPNIFFNIQDTYSKKRSLLPNIQKKYKQSQQHKQKIEKLLENQQKEIELITYNQEQLQNNIKIRASTLIHQYKNTINNRAVFLKEHYKKKAINEYFQNPEILRSIKNNLSQNKEIKEFFHNISGSEYLLNLTFEKSYKKKPTNRSKNKIEYIIKNMDDYV